MSEELTQPDDQAILALLATLERGHGGDELALLPPAQGSESAETLTRLYTEVLGLLPYEAAPCEPQPAVKRRLMAIVRGEELGDDVGFLRELPELDYSQLPELAAVPVLAERRPRPIPVGPVAPSAAAAAPVAPTPMPAAVRTAASAPAPAAMRQVRPDRRWPLALAASLAVLGFALSGWLFFQKSNLETRVAELTRDRNAVISDARTANANLRAANEQLAASLHEIADAKVRLSFMTTPGVEISALKPTGQVPMPETASGMLFVAADHQHWHLSVHGLAPAEKGHRYQLWFIAASGAVSGGMFAGGPGEPVHLGSEHMPPETKAVIITLEPEVGGRAPSGPEYLRSSPPVKIL